MSKLARVLVLGAMLAAMGLGGTAHAQDSDDPPQPTGVTQQDPSPDQPTSPPPIPRPGRPSEPTPGPSLA